MSKRHSYQFTGFSPHTLDFLRKVREENSKPWFEEHRDIYEQHVLQPFRKLVSDLAGEMLVIDASFEVRPSINKTISRIYRDTRFSKDKSLFRGNMWLTFKRAHQDWKGAPAFFFEIFPDWYRYGMGYYNASRSTMDALRESIDSHPAGFMKVTSFLRTHNLYQLVGEKYKRPIPNDHPEEIQDWYQCKSFYITCNKEIDEVLFSPKLVDELIYGFNMLKPLYRYLLILKFRVE